MLISKVRDLIIGFGFSVQKLISRLTKRDTRNKGSCESARLSTTKLKALKSIPKKPLPLVQQAVKLRDKKTERITYAKVTQNRLKALALHLNKSQEFTIDEN